MNFIFAAEQIAPARVATLAILLHCNIAMARCGRCITVPKLTCSRRDILLQILCDFSILNRINAQVRLSR